MSTSAARTDVERFGAAVTRRMGLHFDQARQRFLSDVLGRRLDLLGHGSDTYLRALEEEPCGGEWAALAQELTIAETYFFRNHDQFRALAEIALPERARVATGSGRPLQVLSAGCASGEEAYSLAIVVRETVSGTALKPVIRAVDINPSLVERARQGRYSAWALRDTPADIRRQWFRAEGRDMILDARVRDAVVFSTANIAADDSELWPTAAYDVIFCRNVLMYFSPEQMRATVARLTRALAAGGFLFLGHAETLRGISEAFHLRHSHGAFYYQRHGNATAVTPRLAARSSPNAVLDTAWFDTVREATERVALLLPPQSPAFAPPSWSPAPALDLLRRERFADALDYMRSRPARRDADAMLLEAALLAHDGQFAAAENACMRLLAIDSFNAGARYVLALCFEQGGHRDRAREQDRAAARLDPAFAMPRLHMGLMAQRAGERDAARRELGEALILLRREDPSRLLLFGGGFGRDALIALCEAALRKSGGRP
jgi:chemotaxis protein methyltransferase CheR